MSQDAVSRAAAIQGSLSREQCYVLMMRPNPDAPALAITAAEMRIAHHEYLLDLERRGILFGAGPFVDESGTRHGAGMIIIRAASRAEAEAIGYAEPYTAARQRLMDFLPWQRNEGTVRINLRFADGVLDIDGRSYRLTKS
ncbi:MAG TPA: YciI family protein [Beijerinckiaceae bacterium]|jgi:hypothetical protein|nr:YciI family protein [Beijerinckiaceae bacterium]